MGNDVTRSRPGTAPDPAGGAPPSDLAETESSLASLTTPLTPPLTPMMRQYHEWKRRYRE